MTNLRQGRWLQAFCDACSASSSKAAAALLGASLLPGFALAAPPSHARRPLPTALHSAHIAETASHSNGKRRKGAARDRAGAHAEGAAAKHSAGAHGSAKGRGHGRHSEPVDDPVPMYRAERGGSYGHGHGSANTAWGRHHASPRNEPAPLVTASRHGHEPRYETLAEASRYDREESFSRHSPVHGGRTMVAERVSPSRSVVIRDEPARSMHATPGVGGHMRADSAVPGASFYAEGVSRPDEDDRIVPSRSVPAPVVRVTPTPSTPSAPAPTQLGPVQGFGAEMAVPSQDPGVRPGGTRRRNHPANWTDPSAAITSEPLEDREVITAAAVSPVALPELYDRSGHLVMPAPLKGSHDVLVHQNLMASNDGLERIQDDADLERLRANHQLVALPGSESLHVNDDLPANRRVARPWTVMFAADIGRAFYSRFHEPIYVTSAVRTVHYQAHLLMVNGNAAGLSGDTASPHLTGQAIDLAKRGMSNAELAWMRDYLLPLMRSGKIDVEEEFQQACFHISVYRSYGAGRRVIQHDVAQVQHPAAPVQAGPGPEDTEQER